MERDKVRSDKAKDYPKFTRSEEIEQIIAENKEFRDQARNHYKLEQLYELPIKNRQVVSNSISPYYNESTINSKNIVSEYVDHKLKTIMRKYVGSFETTRSFPMFGMSSDLLDETDRYSPMENTLLIQNAMRTPRRNNFRDAVQRGKDFFVDRARTNVRSDGKKRGRSLSYVYDGRNRKGRVGQLKTVDKKYMLGQGLNGRYMVNKCQGLGARHHDEHPYIFKTIDVNGSLGTNTKNNHVPYGSVIILKPSTRYPLNQKLKDRLRPYPFKTLSDQSGTRENINNFSPRCIEYGDKYDVIDFKYKLKEEIQPMRNSYIPIIMDENQYQSASSSQKDRGRVNFRVNTLGIKTYSPNVVNQIDSSPLKEFIVDNQIDSSPQMNHERVHSEENRNIETNHASPNNLINDNQISRSLQSKHERKQFEETIKTEPNQGNPNILVGDNTIRSLPPMKHKSKKHQERKFILDKYLNDAECSNESGGTLSEENFDKKDIKVSNNQTKEVCNPRDDMKKSRKENRTGNSSNRINEKLKHENKNESGDVKDAHFWCGGGKNNDLDTKENSEEISLPVKVCKATSYDIKIFQNELKYHDEDTVGANSRKTKIPTTMEKSNKRTSTQIRTPRQNFQTSICLEENIDRKSKNYLPTLDQFMKKDLQEEALNGSSLIIDGVLVNLSKSINIQADCKRALKKFKDSRGRKDRNREDKHRTNQNSAIRETRVEGLKEKYETRQKKVKRDKKDERSRNSEVLLRSERPRNSEVLLRSERPSNSEVLLCSSCEYDEMLEAFMIPEVKTNGCFRSDGSDSDTQVKKSGSTIIIDICSLAKFNQEEEMEHETDAIEDYGDTLSDESENDSIHDYSTLDEVSDYEYFNSSKYHSKRQRSRCGNDNENQQKNYENRFKKNPVNYSKNYGVVRCEHGQLDLLKNNQFVDKRKKKDKKLVGFVHSKVPQAGGDDSDNLTTEKLSKWYHFCLKA